MSKEPTKLRDLIQADDEELSVAGGAVTPQYSIVVKTEQSTVPFKDALTNACCEKCLNNLEWEAAFDADGTNYYAKCCGVNYTMRPATVTVEAS